MKNDFIFTLYKNPQSVFTAKSISLIFPDLKSESIKNKIQYALRTKKLIHLRKGMYVKESFNHFELANKLYTPSYISLETVLQKEGIVFQNYKTIYAISYVSRRVNIGLITIEYRKINNKILLNNTGIVQTNNYNIASKERAFLDALTLYKDYHFDNLKPLDWNIVFELIPLYENKALEKRAKEYFQLFRKVYVQS